MFVIRFSRAEKNNHLTGRARYRVTACNEVSGTPPESVGELRYFKSTKSFALIKDSPRKVGTYINPRKELRA